jgi:hypothetical protein
MLLDGIHGAIFPAPAQHLYIEEQRVSLLRNQAIEENRG